MRFDFFSSPVFSRWLAPRGTGKGKIAVNAQPLNSSWGGGNQWLLQLSSFLRYLGFELVYDLSAPDIDCILILHSAGRAQGGTFGLEEIADYKRRRPNTKCLHRINENDARKGTNEMDNAIREMNAVADHTVFVSDWLRSYHSERWFDRGRPSDAILNGAASRHFHPVGARKWKGGSETLILVTHHWSDHWNKGFKVYAEIDRLITEGALPRTELWVVGRWPKEISWKSAKTFPPCHGEELGNLLRQAHVYVTATLAEPGAMHYIEGLQCALPLLYHRKGGGVVEVGEAYGGIPFEENVSAAIRAVKENYEATHGKLLAHRPSGEAMTAAYAEIIEGLVIASRVD